MIESYTRDETRLAGDLEEAQKRAHRTGPGSLSGDVDAFVRLTRAHSEHTRERMLVALPRVHHPADR